MSSTESEHNENQDSGRAIFPPAPPEPGPEDLNALAVAVATSQARAQQRELEFARLMHELTPRVFVTPALVGLNVVLWVVMVVSGVDFLSPTSASLIAWGADFGPRTMHGEWWRIFSSTFLHVGIIHLAFNMWVLWSIGPLAERVLGNLGFLFVYVISGVLASLTSLAWNPLVVSVGASGAIFGVAGALIGFICLQREAIPLKTLGSMRNNMLMFVGCNLLFGSQIKGINLAAHVGGLVAGLVCGLVLSQSLTRATSRKRLVRNSLLAFLGLAATAGAIVALPAAPVNLEQELNAFALLEKQVNEKINRANQEIQQGKLTEDEFAQTIENEVLPEWRKTLHHFQSLELSQPKQQTFVKRLTEYMQLRALAWELTVEGLRQQNMDLIQQANEKQMAADALAKQIGE